MNERRTVVATTTRTRLSRDSEMVDTQAFRLMLSVFVPVPPVPGRPAIAPFALNRMRRCVVTPRTRPSRAADIGVLVTAADLNPDRRSDKPELFAQLVDEEPLVREMERRRDVGEEDERRRSDSDLRRVHDPHV